MNINEQTITISGKKWRRARAAGLGYVYDETPFIEWWREDITIDNNGNVMDKTEIGPLRSTYNPAGQFPILNPETGNALTQQEIAYLALNAQEQLTFCLLFSKYAHDEQQASLPVEGQ